VPLRGLSMARTASVVANCPAEVPDRSLATERMASFV